MRNLVSEEELNEWLTERFNEYNRAGIADQSAPNYEPSKVVSQLISDLKEEFPEGLVIV